MVNMKTVDAIKYFGSKAKLARAFATHGKPSGLARASVTAWGDVVPLMRALQLEKKTFGRLKVDLSCYPDA